MNTPELQQLKMAWLNAKEAGDTQTQLSLLRDNPGEQAALIDFITAYYATGGDEPINQDAPVLSLTQRAFQSALDRVFDAPVTFADLSELRKSRHLSKIDVANGLRLTADVWNKFETGVIELASLSQRQLERLSLFFQVSSELFGGLLNNSSPAHTLYRRQTGEASRQEQQGPNKQSFTDALARSSMSKEDKKFWQS